MTSKLLSERSDSNSTPSVCAIVVTKDPDSGLQSRLDIVKGQVAKIILIDNRSIGQSRTFIEELSRNDNTLVIHNDKNLGVGAALNQGMKIAIENGFEWALMLDQDSYPQPDMIQQMLSTFSDHSLKSEVAIIAPRIIDLGAKREALFLTKRSKFLYRRVSCDEVIDGSLTAVITSGSMLSTQAFYNIGEFREEFFIDYVDTEFCLRARLRGYRILVACQARLMHQFGARKRQSLGPFALFPSFHAPERWYTINRNRIPMIKAYAWNFPHWLMYDITASVYIGLRMLLTEDQKLAKLRAVIRGTWDGLRGRLGLPYWSQLE